MLDMETVGAGTGARSSSAVARVLAHEAKVVVHEGPDGEDVGGVHPGAHDLQPDLVILLDHHVLVARLVARRVGVGVERHVGGDGVAGDEAGEGPDLREQPHLVDLRHHGVQDLALEGPEDDGLVLDGVEHESLAGLDEPGPHVVDAGDGDDEAVLARAGALDLSNL